MHALEKFHHAYVARHEILSIESEVNHVESNIFQISFINFGSPDNLYTSSLDIILSLCEYPRKLLIRARFSLTRFLRLDFLKFTYVFVTRFLFFFKVDFDRIVSICIQQQVIRYGCFCRTLSVPRVSLRDGTKIHNDSNGLWRNNDRLLTGHGSGTRRPMGASLPRRLDRTGMSRA